MDKNEYKYLYDRNDIQRKLNGIFFLHNDVTKIRIENEHYFNITFKILILIEQRKNANSITITLSDIEKLSNFKSTLLNRPSKVRKFILDYIEYIRNPVTILDLTTDEDKKISIFEDIDFNEATGNITFKVAKETEYLLVRNEAKDSGQFFTIRGEYCQGGTYGALRLFLALYTYRNISSISLSKDKLLALCGLKKNTHPSYIIDTIIIPALKMQRLHFKTGSYQEVKSGRTVVGYEFIWMPSKTRALNLTKREELNKKFSNTNLSNIFKPNEEYNITISSPAFYAIWYLMYKEIDKWFQSKNISDSDLNYGFILTAISKVAKKYKCRFLNIEELATYYDKSR